MSRKVPVQKQMTFTADWDGVPRQGYPPVVVRPQTKGGGGGLGLGPPNGRCALVFAEISPPIRKIRRQHQAINQQCLHPSSNKELKQRQRRKTIRLMNQKTLCA